MHFLDSTFGGNLTYTRFSRNGYLNFRLRTLPFLEVQVHFINNHIQTDLHTKPTEKHQYLLKTSCHPNHTKKAIPFSLFLRIRRICSTELPLTNEAENSSSTLPNVVIAAPHYKEMRIAFAQFHLTQLFNRKNRNPPRLTEHPLSHPSILRFLKYICRPQVYHSPSSNCQLQKSLP